MAVSAGTPLDSAALRSYLGSLVPSSTRSELTGSVLPALVHAIGDVSALLRRAHTVAHVGTANAFGDQQLNVDIAADDVIRAACKSCPSIVTASSEETPIEETLRPNEGVTASDAPSPSERYTVAYDPLDGSSIIAPNWTVGAIVGVWDGATALGQNPRHSMVASILGVFGPRTTAIVALRVPGIGEPTCFELGIDGEFLTMVRPSIRFAPPPFKTRYFAPANLRAAAECDKYNALVSHFIGQKYTLRYSGGLVPDVVHALVKGHGVYISPTTPQSAAKLRRLYELSPIALVVECAGGKAVDSSSGVEVLDVIISDCDERGGVICGNKDEVDLAMKLLE
ncbi:uncharacterized protein PgNI_09373 [Pyricularia grisea]|uniref:Sedoheptulose-1,7-bisphosphatase n=1 Tax=Pyricularia grisea TaxID=148305 RepID=A0A6P8ARA5_PYRGI|nr:uncharacterized protein PgNI_09373 [Pyricularia grisea]TLD04635.1 hypothetical protein PgNI_09373 [Pyricularia grisea]